MIVVRFPTKIHFRARVAEWGLGVILFNVGVILLQPAPTFSNPAFESMGRLAPEWAWGLATFAAGGARLLALYRNGAWEPSPFIRMAMAALSAAFWYQIMVSVAADAILPLSLAWLPVFIGLDLCSVYWAAKDAGLSREARRAKPEAPVIQPPVAQ